MPGRWLRAAAIALVLCALPAAAAQSASAVYEPIGSGRTLIKLERSFIEATSAEGVKLSAIAPARLRGRILLLPVSGGRFDPLTGRGTVDHEGGLMLQAGKRRIRVRSWRLRTTQRKSPFSAKVGGNQLKLATAASIVVSRSGFDDEVRVSGLRLSSKLATRLGKKLDRRSLFAAGAGFGASSTSASPREVALRKGGTATLAFAAGFASKLERRFVAANPIFPAEHVGSVYRLPVFAGDLSVDGSAGRVQLAGAIELLQLGGGQVLWRQPWLELTAGTFSAETEVQPAPPYPGPVGRVPLGSLAASGPSNSEQSRRTISLPAATVGLNAGMAMLLNESLPNPEDRSDLFAAGEVVGVITLEAQAQ